MRYIFLLALSLLTISSCTQDTSDQKETNSELSESNTTNTGETSSPASQDQQSYTDSAAIVYPAITFYDWYINAANRTNPDAVCYPDVIEGENGKCKLSFDSYFNNLRSLNVVSETFMKLEAERTKECSAFLDSLDWVDYENSEAYVYQDPCPFFYYQYWTRTQEDYHGADVESISQQGGNQYDVTLVFYVNYDGKKDYIRYNQPVVRVVKEKDQWVIAKIDWKEN